MKMFTRLMLLLVSSFWMYSATAQISILETFNVGSTGWTLTGFSRTTSTTGVCSGAGALRRNFYSSAQTGSAVSPTGTSNGQDLTITFSYKIINFSGGGATSNSPAWGTMATQVSIDGGTNYSITAGTINSTNHVSSTACATVTYTVPAASVPNASSVKVRFNGAWLSGDYYFTIDEVVITQPSLTPPNCATLSTPANAATGVSTATALTWTAATGGPTSYDVYFGTTTNPPLVGNVAIPTTTYTPTGVLENTTYYWKIVPKNINGGATGCAENTFTTILCNTPTSAAATAITHNSAAANWTPTSGNFIIEYGPTSTFGTAGTGATAGNANNFIATASNVGTYTLTGLIPVTGYTYVVRKDCSAASGGYSANSTSRTFTTPGAPPPNDACTDAITIASCTPQVSGTSVNSTVDANYINCGALGSNTTERGVWYKIVGDNNLYTITTCDPTGAGYDSRITVYSGTCGALTCVTANDDMSPACATGSYRSSVTFSALLGTEYLVFVHGYQSGTGLSATGAFNLNITCTALCTPATTNDVCTAAQSVSVAYPGVSVSTNNSCAAADGGGLAFPSCGSQFDSYFDTWYSFNTGSNTDVNITLTKGTATGLGFTVYSGACGTLTQISCTSTSTFSGATITVPLTGLTASTTYYIRAFSINPATRGTFDVMVESPAPCPAPTTLTATSVTATGATIGWAAGSTTLWDVYVSTENTAPDGTTEPTIEDVTNPATVSGLTAETPYFVWVRADCNAAGFGTSSWGGPVSFTTTAAAPDCSAGTVVECGTPTTFTTAVGSGAWSVASCGFSTPGRELVYQFTPTVTGAHNLVVTAGTGGFYDYFFKESTGTCDATGWTCIDDISGSGTVAFTVTAGTTYYILIDKEATTVGGQTFTIQCPTAWYPDVDMDGYGAASATAVIAVTQPANTVADNTDCDDTNGEITPVAEEVCDGVDNNCAAGIDEGLLTAYYTDGDGDTYGTGAAQNLCANPGTLATVDGDCDDSNAAVNPGATEVCNGIDDNCDGISLSNDLQATGVAFNPWCTPSATPSGRIFIQTAGGNAPYSYAWSSPSTFTGNDNTGLDVGTYTCTISDNIGCAVTVEKTLVVTTAPLAATFVLEQNICFGAAKGKITCNPTGGSGYYTYAWSNGKSSKFIANLAAGTYTCTVTDALGGCTSAYPNTITAPPAPVITIASVVTQNTTTGVKYRVTVASPAATPLFRRSTAAGGWTGYGSSTVFNLLPAATYTFMVKDANGCTGSITSAIPQTSEVPVFDRYEQSELTGVEMTLSPNPATDVLNVAFVNENELNGDVLIFDSFNRLVKQQRATLTAGGGNVIITLDDMVSGTYRLQFRTADGKPMTKPFVVVK